MSQSSKKFMNEINGIIVINKEINYTSRDVVNKLTNILKTKKIGHTGTLDPLATGVLVVCLGKYTKLVDLITSYQKEYLATIKLGIKTDTLDITGNVIQETEAKLSKNSLEKVLRSFPKTYQQEVPLYSAVKINGKKLYQYARQKEFVKLPKKEVNIYDLKLISYEKDEIVFKALVSKGTYIRSLIRDILFKLNVVGTMKSLTRTKQGVFDLADSYTLDQIAKDNYKLLKTKDILTCPLLELSDREYFKVKNGQKMEFNFPNGLIILTYQNKEVAIYEIKDNLGKLKVLF